MGGLKATSPTVVYETMGANPSHHFSLKEDHPGSTKSDSTKPQSAPNVRVERPLNLLDVMAMKRKRG